MTIKSSPLNSSFLSSATYDDDTQALTLNFTKSGSYTFQGVPPDVYEGLTTAQSPGQFYHTNIKGIYT